MNLACVITVCLIFCLNLKSCLATDSLSAAQTLKNNDSLVSSGGTFKLGFFSLSNTTDRYLGIWYNKIPVLDVVWVGNRMNPLNDSSGVAKISEDGNLQVVDGKNKTVWSSNVSHSLQGSDLVLRILESGNLVLVPSNTTDHSSSANAVWQSYEDPTDTMLPSMTVGTNTGRSIAKIGYAWKSPTDPSNGRYALGFSSYTLPEVVIYDGDAIHWRSGPWNGNLFIGIPYNNSDNQDSGFVLQSDRQRSISLTYTYSNSTFMTNYKFAYDGTFFRQLWVDAYKKWVTEWIVPSTECDFYGKCGAFGICNPKDSVICQCQKGFVPKNEQEWMKGNWSSGCVRRKPVQCAVRGGIPDKFFRQGTVKVPAKAAWSIGLDQNQCRDQCTGNCSCLAYAFDSGAGCMSWDKALVDTQTLSAGGVDLYIRLEHSELAESSNRKTIIAVTVSLGAAITLLSILFLWRWKAKQRGKRLLKIKTLKDMFGGESKYEELPLFEFEKLQIATNYFHESHELGRGGFGPVYKGKLEDGQDIAVKRLSQDSGQGTKEFVNEVQVISKLQHRNLVKLLGCCVEGEEKMLVYEFMPNKSLDAILFDEQKRELLPWPKRFNIIDGICRGLLYLHRDSRLKIIHRDLKTSNILLDENLNPKISDFGMARIFGGNEIQGDTLRVVGTYGYMPPEYAMEGRFSEKSDVFSFGVILLEIISGIKNSNFWLPDESKTLLGYAWMLWQQGNIDPLVDKTITKHELNDEIQTCVKIGLLCVQEFPKDRPNISTVITMLSSNEADLPAPKKPAYTQRHDDSEISSGGKSHFGSSINDISISVVSGR